MYWLASALATGLFCDTDDQRDYFRTCPLVPRATHDFPWLRVLLRGMVQWYHQVFLGEFAFFFAWNLFKACADDGVFVCAVWCSVSLPAGLRRDTACVSCQKLSILLWVWQHSSNTLHTLSVAYQKYLNI